MIERCRHLLRRFWGNLPASMSNPERAEWIRRLGLAMEPAAIPMLVMTLFDADDEVAASAAGSIERILRSFEPLDLARLDRDVRDIGEWRFPAKFDRLVRQCVPELTRVTGVLSMHPNGRVREGAVRLLSDVLDGSELPFLLIRLNDWVPQVREAASNAVSARIRDDYAPHLVDCLPLVERLAGQRRDDHGLLLEAVRALFASERNRPALLRGIESRDPHTRRGCFRLLVQSLPPGKTSELREILRSPDPVIRFRSLRELLARLPDEGLRPALASVENDPFVPVRRAALIAYAERLSALSLDRLNAALLDCRPSLRDVARFYLRQRAQPDFAALYAAHLDADHPREVATAIAGLGEVGSKQDAIRLIPFLRHADAKVRRAAVRAVAHLDIEQNVELLLQAVSDPSTSVCHAARDVLLSYSYLLKPGALWAAFQHAAPPHAKKAIILLIDQLRWWDGAALLIRITGGEDPACAALAAERLMLWRSDAGRLSVRPTHDQIGALEEALGLNRAALDPRIVVDAEAHLSYVHAVERR